MRLPANIQGKKFGRLTEKENLGITNGKTIWLCMCDCGNSIDVSANALQRNNTSSCGCLASERIKGRFTKHGLYKSKLFKVYHGMVNRCYHLNLKESKNYGQRGIKVCDAWLNDKTVFFEWALKNGWREKLQIDRINPDGNYCPANCRFVTGKENTRNRRTTLRVEYGSVIKPLGSWCEEMNLKYSVIRNRIINLKWSVEKSFYTPIKSRS